LQLFTATSVETDRPAVGGAVATPTLPPDVDVDDSLLLSFPDVGVDVVQPATPALTTATTATISKLLDPDVSMRRNGIG
jgi:hypothetical protein